MKTLDKKNGQFFFQPRGVGNYTQLANNKLSLDGGGILDEVQFQHCREIAHFIFIQKILFFQIKSAPFDPLHWAALVGALLAKFNSHLSTISEQTQNILNNILGFFLDFKIEQKIFSTASENSSKN